MTSGSSRVRYPLGVMEVGAVYAHRVETPEEQKRVRRAAHNRNSRTDKFFTTHIDNGVIYITRVR